MTPPRDQFAWNRRNAAHVLRRAGFREDEAGIRRAAADGRAATIERLTIDQPESERFVELDGLGERLALRDDISALAGWWLARMVYTANPLRARMALFWHSHFATSNAKVRSAAMMLGQLRAIEKHALGAFEDLVLAMARDPAMITWLDGDSNNKGRPNENFARELLELFTLGVGHYTERDIKETARAFTGWHQRRGQFVFDKHEHDAGMKHVFGCEGRFSGDDVAPIILRQPAAADFIARKLVREFASDNQERHAALTSRIAGVLRESGFDLRKAIRAILSSDELLSPDCYRARISSPVEFIVGAARALRLRIDMPAAARAAGEMGQRLFEPPTVKGWDGGRAWINSATMLARINAAAHACGQREDGAGFDARQFARQWDVGNQEGAQKMMKDLLLDGDAPDGLAAAMNAIGPGASVEESLRHAARCVIASPEHQLA